MKESSTDVLVVGAGPVGLLAAAELRRHGVECLTVDRLASPPSFTRAVTLQPRTLDICQALGLDLEDGLPLKALNVYRDGRLLARHPLRVLSLELERAEEVLAERLQSLGGRIERHLEFRALNQDEDGVTALLDEERVRCRYLLGCDGPQSKIREALHLEMPRAEPTRWRFWDVELEWPLAEGEVHSFEGGPQCVPLKGVWRYQVSMAERPDVTELEPLLPPGSKCGELRWSGRYGYAPGVADHYRHQRVFLAGDAVHEGGHGLNTGLQDAHNLAWKLALVLQGKVGRQLLDSYEAERRPAALASLDEPFQGLAGDRGARYPNLPSYPADAEPRAGDPAPDGVLVRDGQNVRVFDLFHGTRHCLLAFAGGAGGGQITRLEAQVAEKYADRVQAHLITVSRGQLIDPDYRLHEAYGFDGPGVALVRPDGYLGFRADLGHVDELLPYLQNLFLPL